jgi:hypothetical protein
MRIRGEGSRDYAVPAATDDIVGLRLSPPLGRARVRQDLPEQRRGAGDDGRDLGRFSVQA